MKPTRTLLAHICISGTMLLGGSLKAQERAIDKEDSVAVRFVDADLRTVVQALARYLPKPVMMGALPGHRVTLESPGPVAQRNVLPLLRGLLESQQLRLAEDSSFFAVVPGSPPSPPAREGMTGGAAALVTLQVIRLKHARAADVAATVNLLFGGGAGDFSGRTGLSGGTLSDDLRRTGIVSTATPVVPPAAQPPGRPAILSSQVVIVPDEITNALLVRGTEQDVAVLKEAVAQLDVRPLQVLIEVLIVEARKDRSWSIGADITVPPQSLGGDATVEGTTVGGGLGDVILKFMKLGKGDVNAVIRLAQARGDVRIVSRPVLLASNNVEARFLVGSQRPFVQISRTQPTDGATRDQVVQYKDVGTKLIVRPTINHDGYVSLLVQQEISTATDETQFDAPIISTREAVTQVLVRDGQTIVIGGLRDRLTSDVRSGVPILSTIPLLGGLFGTASRRRAEVELFLFLTPRIIAEDEDVERVKSALQATEPSGR